MRELVALDCAGPTLVAALEAAWDAGDAVAPIDGRLAATPRSAVLGTLAPTAVVDRSGIRHRLEAGRPVEDGDAVVIATSGTTGAPRAVVLTHAAVEASALASTRALGVDPTRDRWLSCLPAAHIGGLSVIMRALLSGTALTAHERFDAAAVDAAARAGATLVSLVPTALRRIDPGLWRCILLGGQAPPDDLDPNVVSTYGMTETGSGIAYDGRPLDGVELDIARDGEILVRAPMLLRAYRDGTVPVDSGGWFATGDMGRIDGGRLRVEGRRGDLIITGGENVWPAPVEAALAQVAGVAEVAVVGVPDPEWGQRVVAVVVPESDTAPPTLDSLRAVVRDRVAPYAAPRSLHLVRSLPRTGSGKVRRAALAAAVQPDRADGG